MEPSLISTLNLFYLQEEKSGFDSEILPLDPRGGHFGFSGPLIS